MVRKSVVNQNFTLPPPPKNQVRLRRARGVMGGYKGKTRARLNLTPNLLSPQKHIYSVWVRVCNERRSLTRAESLQLYSQVCLLFVNEKKPGFLNHFFFQTCAIISISWGKVNFIIQTKNLQGEPSKSVRKILAVYFFLGLLISSSLFDTRIMSCLPRHKNLFLF